MINFWNSPGSATPPVISRHKSSEWSNHEILEFVPQAYNAHPAVRELDVSHISYLLNSYQGDGDPFSSYNDVSQYNTMESTPPHTQPNPYRDDAPSGAQPFFQNMNGLNQPVIQSSMTLHELLTDCDSSYIIFTLLVDLIARICSRINEQRTTSSYPNT